MQETITHPAYCREKSHYKTLKARNGITGFVVSRPGHGTRPSTMSSKDYIPGTADENLIFETQQKFMFTVLNEHLQTDMGKPRQEIHGTHDAQKIFR
jgi:hypothetical protein